MSSNASPDVAAGVAEEPPGGEVAIAAGDQRAVVVCAGGGLRTYTVGGRDLLDGSPPGAAPRSGRGQVLIPWPNRLEDGRYEFDGRRHQLPLNEPQRRNAIHGLVRSESWAVGAREPHRVVMEHTLQPRDGYPFTLALGIEYALSDAGLRVTTTATNIGADACPFGAGAHPYLTAGTPTVDSATLRVPADTVLRCDDRGLPIGAEPVAATDHDFRRTRPIGTTHLDHAFTDLDRGDDGLARVELAGAPGDGLTLWLGEAFGYVMVFTGDPLPDVARHSIAIEPMTCPPNAFRTGDAVVRIEPGASFRGVWGITPATGHA